MAKKLFFLLCPLLFIGYQCPLKDGSIVEISCKVEDMQGNPMKGVTLSLISSDSFSLPLKPRLEQQKITDSKGELTFIYEHNRLLFRFIRGEKLGNLAAVELLDAPRFPRDTGKLIFSYDSLVPIKIRFTSARPLMKNGKMDLYMYNGPSQDGRLLNTTFPISANRIDTLFKVNVFSQPRFNVNSSLIFRDTLKQRDTTLWRSISIPTGGKRDTVFTLAY